MSATIDKQIAVRVTNITELRYLIENITQTAVLSVVTLEQSKSIQPFDTSILSLIQQGDPDLINNLNGLLKTNKPEQQSFTLCFPTLKTPVKTEDRAPLQALMLLEMHELKKIEKREIESKLFCRIPDELPPKL